MEVFPTPIQRKKEISEKQRKILIMTDKEKISTIYIPPSPKQHNLIIFIGADILQK